MIADTKRISALFRRSSLEFCEIPSDIFQSSNYGRRKKKQFGEINTKYEKQLE